MSNTLADSAKFCCGRLIGLRQIERNVYGAFELEADGFTISDQRHVCEPEWLRASRLYPHS